MTSLSNFPGVVAQEVSPNPKCNNCLHYQNNAGKVGVCTIGLRPWLCGEGDNQVGGYSPLDGQKPTEPGDAAPIGQAADIGGRPDVPMSLTVLGDEHATMVKSIHDELRDIERLSCPLHQNQGVAKSYNASVGAVVCNCQRIASSRIAKRLYKALENKERLHLTEGDVLFFVRGVRKGMEPFDIALAKLHFGVQVPDDMNKSMSASERKALVPLGNNNALAKSLYGDDWTTQFLGTDLFDEAAKLREQEITRCEEDLKRRIERIKKMKEAPKVTYDNDDYEQRYADDERIRIAKAKLMLKLQKHRNKQMSPKKG